MASKIKINNANGKTLAITNNDTNFNDKEVDIGEIALTRTTVADMIAIVAPSDNDVCVVTDKNQGGTFVYDSSKITEDNKGTNFNGWIRQYSGAVNVKWFGANENRVDNEVPIQMAIDLSLRYNKVHTIFIPSGSYTISDTIHLGYGNSYQSISLVGSGKTLESTMPGTKLFPTFSDRPCVSIQGGRGTTIDGIYFEGAFHSFAVNNRLARTDCKIDDTVLSAWTDNTLSVNAYSSTAPFACIAVDPFSGSKPSVSYPDVTYPEWTGITTQYEKNASSSTLIKNCKISGFVVGVVIQPSGFDGNGDFNTFENTQIIKCVYGISISNSQARNFNMIGLSSISFCYNGLTTKTHGAKNGNMSGCIVGANLDRCIYLLDIGVDVSKLELNSCYAEGAYSLGSIGNSSGANASIMFNNCSFSMSGQMEALRGVPDYALSGSNCTVNINGGIFSSGDRYYFPTSADIVINVYGTKFGDGTSTVASQGDAVAANALRNGGFNPMCRGSVKSFNNSFNIDTLSPIGAFSNSNEPRISYGRIVNFPSQIETFDYECKNIKINQVHNYINTDIWKNLSVNGRIVTVDITTSASNRAKYGIDLGDLIFKENTMYYVKSLSGTVATLVGVSNYTKDGILNEPITIGGDAMYMHSRITLIPNVPYRLEFTKGSSTVHANRISDNYNGAISSYFTVGDRLMIVDELAGIDTGSLYSKITGIDDSAGTLTLASAVNATRSVTCICISRTFES